MKNNYTLSAVKKVKWGVLEENQPISLYPVMYPGWTAVIGKTEKTLGKSQKNIACLHVKDKGIIFVDEREMEILGKFALNKLTRNPAWGINLNKKIIKLSDELVNFTHNKILLADVSKKTSQQLYRLYQEHDQRHGDLYSYADIVIYMDLYKPYLTRFLIEYLEKQIKKVGYNKTAKECFALLTVPEESSKVQLEEISLLRIALEIKKTRQRKNKARGYYFNYPRQAGY